MLTSLLLVTVLSSSYVESVRLQPDFLIGSGQATGTVVMSHLVAAPTVVTLETDAWPVTTPPSVTVQPGQKTAGFVVEVMAPARPVVANVIAHSQGYSQRAKMAAVATLGDLAISNLSAKPGAGGIWLGWPAFPEDIFGRTLPGYHVFRRHGAGAFARVGNVTDSGSFIDTTAAGGVVYTYRVELRTSDGLTLAASPKAVVTKTGGPASIFWPPTVPPAWSGATTVLLKNPDQTQEQYDVFINDRRYGTASATEADGGSSDTIRLVLDTTQMANSVDLSESEPPMANPADGNYKIVLASADEDGTLHASAPLFFSVSNPLSSVSNDGVTQTSGAEYGAIAGRFREEGPCSVELQTEAGETVRRWEFAGRRFSIVWDGRDALGATVPDGSYRWKIEGPGGGGSHYHRIVKVGASPEFLAIVNYHHEEPWRTEKINYARRLEGYLRQMSGWPPRFSWLVYTLSEEETVDRAMVRKICRWLRESTRYFYFSGHGSPMPERTYDHHFLIGQNVRLRNHGAAVKEWETITVQYWVGER
jgi:hypothetical protein